MFWIFGHEACGILALLPEIKPAPPALQGGLNHWTTLDFHICICFESTGLITSNPRHPEANSGLPESPQSPPGCVPFSPGILLKVFFFQGFSFRKLVLSEPAGSQAPGARSSPASNSRVDGKVRCVLSKSTKSTPGESVVRCSETT